MSLAVVTGASTGIGYELARFAVEDGHDLLICADEPEIEEAAGKLRRLGGQVEALQLDLATREGIEALWQAVEPREVDLFLANAGRALGGAFAGQDWGAIERLILLNLTQTTLMLHRVGRKMQARGQGRILVTGSIGGYVPGPFDAVYNATKAYLDSLSHALQDEWRETPVTVTCLMPGPTDTEIFTRPANRLADAPIAQSDSLDDVTMVARAGYEAMLAGKPGVIPGFTNRVMTAVTGLVPQSVLAQIHRMRVEPK